MSSFKLALIQMRVEGGKKEVNLCHASELIQEAALNKAAIAVLPEALNLGWTHPATKTEADSIPDGKTCKFLIDEAKKHRLFLCAGLVERDQDKIFNSAVIISPDGSLLLRHRKLNELEIGHPYYDQGDRLNVCHTDLGTLGLMICADAFAKDQVISRSLGYMGAEIVLSPCAWAVSADHDNVKEPYGSLWRKVYKPVAKEFSMWIVGVSNVGWVTDGPWKGKKCIGCSLVIGPDGQEIIQGPYGADAETVIYVNVQTTKRPARGCGWETYCN